MEPFAKDQPFTADPDLGVAFGFGIVCKEGGEPYYDLQGDHITEDCMLKAAVDFMEKSQVMKAGHKGAPVGKMWVMPITSDILDEIKKGDKTGLFVMAKPNEEVLKQMKDGTFKGFSVGGRIVESVDG